MKKLFILLALTCSGITAAPFEQLFHQGNTLFHQGKYEPALASYMKALELSDQYPELFFNIGTVHLIQKNIEAAISYFEKAVALKPEYAKAHIHLGRLYTTLKNTDNAIYHYSRALEIEPTNLEVLLKLSALYKEQEDCFAAAVTLLKAVDLKPDDVGILFEYAYVNTMIGNTAMTKLAYEKILSLQPNNTQIFYNLGYTYKMEGNTTKAIEYYQKALALKPDYEEAHFAMALAHLMAGDFTHGWPLYERFLKNQQRNGESIRSFLRTKTMAGKRIVLRPEGHFGDTFQFIRFAKELHDLGARVVVIAQPQLHQLLKLCSYIDELEVSGTPIKSPIDGFATFMSMSCIMNADEQMMGRSVPYLYADTALIEYWHTKLANDTNIKVGLVWQADVKNDVSRFPVARRGIPLKLLATTLKDIPGVSFYSLQKVDGVEQLKDLPAGFELNTFGADFDESHGRFMDTAAVMKNLDVVLTVDTAVAHLAGGLGVKTWVMLPWQTDWRWIAGRTDCPWYPTMRIFKQPQPFDWENVANEIHTMLSAMRK